MGKGERQEKMYNQALHHTEMDLDKIDINAEPPIEEPARQYYFIAKCREWVEGFERKAGRCPSFFTQPDGCQMNTEVEIKKAA